MKNKKSHFILWWDNLSEEQQEALKFFVSIFVLLVTIVVMIFTICIFNLDK